MKSNSQGFTLVELLVALTILSVIATLLASGTRLTLDLSARGNAKREAIRIGVLGRTLLRNQLQGALPFHYWTTIDDMRVERVAFDGRADRIRFVSRDGISDGPGSFPRWVEIRSKNAQSKTNKVVVEEHRILSPDNLPSEATTAQAEVLDCSDFRFDYLDTANEKPQWYPSWDATEHRSLPAAIRIHCGTNNVSTELLIPLDYAQASLSGSSIQ